MSDEQLHSLDEQELVSQWKQDGEVISETDQTAAIEALADSREKMIQNNETLSQIAPEVDEETAAARRAELAQQIADEEAK